jgi:peptidoglycan/xylan/chitin deacetylase (PgdA/CDA1 family)
MNAARRQWLAWSAPGAAILLISVGLTLTRADLATDPTTVRFSGSTVVRSLPSLLPSARLPARVRVHVVRDEAAARYHDGTARFDSIMQGWHDVLEAAGADARIVSSASLRSLPAAQVLVIPASPCLSVATREAIERVAARGQGLVVTGPVGTRDAGCRQIGFGLLAALTGASRAAVLSDPGMVYVAVPDGGPLSIDVPPGARIDVHPAGQLALRGTERDAIYAGYDLRPLRPGGEPFLDAALTLGKYGGARVAYWGFELHDVVDQPWNRAVAALLVRNAVAWAAGLPSAGIEPWPADQRAAVLIAQDVESEFGNAEYAADSLHAIGVPSSFFLTSDLGRRHRRLVGRLGRIGEIGSHSENHQLLGGLAAQLQRVRLERTQRGLADLLGERVSGLRPPQEQFDRATMQAWLDVGGTYLFGANDGRAAAPELLQVGQDTLVLLSRITPDDAALAGSSSTPTAAAAVFLDDFAHVRALGGLYALSYHSHLLSQPEQVPALALVARAIAADSTVWIATASDLAAWWRARAGLQATVRARSARELIVTVRNTRTARIDNAVVRISLPHAPRSVRSDAALLPAEPGLARVILPPLDGGAVREFSLRW